MPILVQVYTLLILSLVVASIAWTVTQETIFEEWRDGAKRRSENASNILARKFFYVWTCEYCFSHWVTILVLIVSDFRLLIDDWRGYALAFFVHESACGTRGVARFTHSLGNIRWTEGYDNYEGYRSYGSWQAGMEDWYKLIAGLYINGWGLRTVDQIIPVYAPAADSNNPPTYIASVKSMVDSWRGK